MLRVRALLIVGLVTFLGFALLNVPARVAADLLPATVQAGMARGTLWAGELASLRVAGISLGRTRWQLHPAGLLLGRLDADLDTELPGGFARGRLVLGAGGSVALRNAEAVLPLAVLATPLRLPGLAGEASLKLSNLALDGQWVTAAVGELRAADVPLALPGMQAPGGASGSFQLLFDAPEVPPDGPLVGQVTDLGGALEVSAELQLRPPTRYAVEGLVRPRPEAPEELTRGLVLLGAPDSEGRRPFALSGSF